MERAEALLEEILDNPNCVLTDSIRERIRTFLDRADAWAIAGAEECKSLGCDRPFFQTGMLSSEND